MCHAACDDHRTDIADRMTPRQLIRPGVMADERAGAQAEQHLREMAEDIRNQQSLRRRQLRAKTASARQPMPASTNARHVSATDRSPFWMNAPAKSRRNEM